MSIDITPNTGANQEVNVGDAVKITADTDGQVGTANITLTIEADSGTLTKTGSDLTETDNGDGTYTYSYTHELDRRHTSGDWDVDGGGDNAHESWYINAQG